MTPAESMSGTDKPGAKKLLAFKGAIKSLACRSSLLLHPPCQACLRFPSGQQLHLLWPGISTRQVHTSVGHDSRSVLLLLLLADPVPALLGQRLALPLALQGVKVATKQQQNTKQSRCSCHLQDYCAD